ncbi:hypothetical protein [Massilia yuzhufengensis]|uniref:Trypsin-like peptidase domain-containing protein n=1 Tax=Massilia yuzhufengensis TaxID=1164594 RepID=A0A1I1N2W0_9BURK|nr:hypothetical protein [Massilia yuzhufengensis]SFC91532.1 hypothetical protein SAMN05216204_11249 [Massilia yuzhufengensis]
MNLDSVWELRQQAVAMLAEAQKQPFAAGLSEGHGPEHFIAVGIAPTPGKRDYRLAVRFQRKDLEASPAVDQLIRLARGEADVRYIGSVRSSALLQKLSAPRHRPLQIGSSVAHYRGSPGTLGAFVKMRNGLGSAQLLSNNHIIANEDRSKKQHDALLQPGIAAGGNLHKDRVGTLTDFTPLLPTGNRADCAIAEIDQAIGFDPYTIRGLGRFSGRLAPAVDVDLLVAKLGAESALTHGRIEAFAVKSIMIGYPTGKRWFDEQIEVEGLGAGAFSEFGDSGSLVVDGDMHAVGLVFARSRAGGANGKGLTYVNPMTQVLDALRVDLI